MITAILVFLIAISGLIMIAGGVWGLFYLWNSTVRIPLRYYAAVIGMICGGLGMWVLRRACA